jgi:phenol/toluene 2-monooxygenase (NADH) P1/A1
MVPIVELALGAAADDAVGEQVAAFKARIAKTGITL